MFFFIPSVHEPRRHQQIWRNQIVEFWSNSNCMLLSCSVSLYIYLFLPCASRFLTPSTFPSTSLHRLPSFCPPSLSWTLTPPPVSSPPSFSPSTFANQSLSCSLSLICFSVSAHLPPCFLVALVLHSQSSFALISHLPPTTPGWDSGKYSTELDRTLPGGSKGRPCRRTEAIVLRSANTIRCAGGCSENDHPEPLPAQLRFHYNGLFCILCSLADWEKPMRRR